MPMIYVKKKHYDALLRIGENPAEFVNELLENHLKEVNQN